jgi:hypothetical protein
MGLPTVRTIVIAVLDVGSRAKLGWCRVLKSGDQASEVDAGVGDGGLIEGLIEVIGEDLLADRAVALGFEAPLFVPLPAAADDLGKGRVGEGNRPWSAGAGAAVMAYAAQQVAWVLTALRHRSGEHELSVGVDPVAWRRGDLNLLLWEAFVSGAAKDRASANQHVEDARAAAREFLHRFEAGALESDVTDRTVFSVVGAAILRAGLSTDTGLLAQAPLVIRAPDLR